MGAKAGWKKDGRNVGEKGKSLLQRPRGKVLPFDRGELKPYKGGIPGRKEVKKESTEIG